MAKKSTGGKISRSGKTGRFTTVKESSKSVPKTATKSKPGNPPNTTKG